MENLGKRLPYYGIFGGVSALSKEQMVKVNGYSNMYFGWGGEGKSLIYLAMEIIRLHFF